MLMDSRILELGSKLTYCPYREECPGIRAGLVKNDPEAGVFPRGFLVTPLDARPEDIRLVVLGQNPGAWDEEHRTTMLKLTEGKSSSEAYEAINGFFIPKLPTYPYNKLLNRMIEALFGSKMTCARLEAEVVCCETSASSKHPGDDTLNYCAKKHLKNQLALLTPDVYVMCVGAPARDWFAKSKFKKQYRWFSVPHPSAYGVFWKVLDKDTDRLKPEAQVLWNEFLTGKNGVRLG